MGYLVSFLAGALGFSIFDKTTENKQNAAALPLGQLAAGGILLYLGYKLIKKLK